jgi:hypothetical protein
MALALSKVGCSDSLRAKDGIFAAGYAITIGVPTGTLGTVP